MSKPTLLQRVSRSGLRIGATRVPIAFFSHGRPGQRFVVRRAEGGRHIHVRAADKEAIENVYRQYAAAQPPRQSRRRSSRTDRQATAIPPLAGIGDPPTPAADISSIIPSASNDSNKLKEAERRELEQANALAVQLVEMKTRLLNAGRNLFANRELLQLEKRHVRHLERCMRLRALLAEGVRGPREDLHPA